MKFYNLDNSIEVDVSIAKALLELPEEEFYEYENFSKDFNSLINSKGYNYLDFKNACDMFLNSKKKMSKLYKKMYRNFISKYSIFIKKLISSLDYYSMDKMYKLLKVTYKNRSAILERMNKLSEIGINNFWYVFESDLNDNLAKCDSINKIIDVATDGNVTYEEINGPYCYINIKGAKYILEYSKEIKYGLSYIDSMMIVSNLMFDISTLPTYEQLNDFNAKPYIDYQEAVKQDKISKQKQNLIDYVLYAEDVLVSLNDLERRIQNLINNTLNNSNGISENELQKLQEIYLAISSHKDEVINNGTNDTSMSVDEIKYAVKVKKRERTRRLLDN